MGGEGAQRLLALASSSWEGRNPVQSQTSIDHLKAVRAYSQLRRGGLTADPCPGQPSHARKARYAARS